MEHGHRLSGHCVYRLDMWIVTTRGFLSVVRNENSTGSSGALLVRGRVRADLDRFAEFAESRGERPAVTATPAADYGFRLTTSRETLATFLVSSVDGIDYPNFKGRICESDPVREGVYEDAWRALQGLSRVKS